MKAYFCCLWFILLTVNNLFFSISADALSVKEHSSKSLMTAPDIQENSFSNVSIKNANSQPIAVAGLFISSFDVNDCSSCSGGVSGGDNLGGALVSPVNISANQSIPIGKNYLYNMIYNGIYYLKKVISSPCSLPGCSWPGDNPNVRAWCLTINAVSLNSNYTYSNYFPGSGSFPLPASPRYGGAGNATTDQYQYKYDLINPNTLGTGNSCIGPIVCNDKTLTCEVATPQNEVLQAYS